MASSGRAFLALAVLFGAGHSHAADIENSGPYTLWVFEDEHRNERIAAIDGPKGFVAVRGTGDDFRYAELVDGKPVHKRLKRLLRAKDVAVVEIGGRDGKGVSISAQGDAGEAFEMKIGEGIVRILANDGDERVQVSIGGEEQLEGAPAVRIDAREGRGERALVVIRGVDEDEVRDFVKELDGLPRQVERAMLAAAGLD